MGRRPLALALLPHALPAVVADADERGLAALAEAVRAAAGGGR